MEVRRRYFLRRVYIKMIHLPRQARDKHRENSKKSAVFLQRSSSRRELVAFISFDLSHDLNLEFLVSGLVLIIGYETAHFAKTGSG
jgi:hypothetical protein